jgi:hypothetical protein
MTTETSATLWTVQERAWKDELPELSDDVIALLAPPVVVSASSWTAPTAPTGPTPPPATPTVVRAPQFLAPGTTSRNTRRRTAGRAVPRATARVA